MSLQNLQTPEPFQISLVNHQGIIKNHGKTQEKQRISKGG
jgi:hypothetical protein